VAKSLGLVDDIQARRRRSAPERAPACANPCLGDICEAVIGAVFLDGGYAAAAQFVERNWTERMRKPRRPLRDPKTGAAGMGAGQGAADAGLSRGRAHRAAFHDPQFRVAVDLPGLAPAEGIGRQQSAPPKRSQRP